MVDLIVQSVPLGSPPWPTLDPFLFCVHHKDDYPRANDLCGPDADLAGRALGQDFSGQDGWSMYHGSGVPGFPEHPHRGFETVTFVERGLIDHADSLGAAARYGDGDVQWMTAGRGIVHAEMFPLLDRDDLNRNEFFQIWVNLPARDKMVEPHFSMLWDDSIPKVAVAGEGQIIAAAGAIEGAEPPSPPPHSWASRPDSDVAIWRIELRGGERVQLPAGSFPDTARVLYVYDGDGASVGTQTAAAGHAHVVRTDSATPIQALGSGTKILVLQGRPIGEPVAQYGPFVMNTKAEIQRAFDDYQSTRFGGWPWDRVDPVHGTGRDRFARHADGFEERAGA